MEHAGPPAMGCCRPSACNNDLGLPRKCPKSRLTPAGLDIRWRPRAAPARGATPLREAAAMKIRPLHDRVVIKRIAEEEKTKGGIIIPDTAKEKPVEGEVVAVGNGVVNQDGKVRALDVKKGDRVLFGKYSGNEIKLDGQ